MRWLFLILLSLNFAYIAWQLMVPREGAYMQVQPLKNVQPIVLLSELDQKSELAAGVAETVSEAAQVTEKIVAESAAADKKIIAEEKMVAVVPESEKTGVAEPVVTVSPVAEIKKTEAEGEGSVPDQASAPLPEAAKCYTLGPFRNLDTLRSLTRDIKSYVTEADFRGREEKEQTLFWVYIQPEKNHKKALETGKRLKEKKIKDFYVIREGEKIHGISLGHFRNKDGAYGLLKRVKKLGFDVKIEPVFKTYTVYWLDYQLVSGVSIPERIVDKYIKAAKKDKISRLNRVCAG